MIYTFPNPYPDELAYSLFARYSDRMRFPIRDQALVEIFGSRDTIIAVDLLHDISRLLTKLPSSQGYTVDSFINNHTLLPFYAPFLTIERVERIRRHIAGTGDPADRRGLSALRSGYTPWLRICPSCAAEERQELGECYWHRLAQVPGVEVCPKHMVWLELTDVVSNSHMSKRQLIPARQAQILSTPRSHNLSQQTFRVLVDIAQLTGQLLQQGVITFGQEALGERYRLLLMERGYSSAIGFISWNRLIHDFIAQFDTDLLRMLGCDLDPQSRASWFIHLITDSKHTKPPLHHLLLLRFLGHTVESIRAVSPIYEPFGRGPWPCLNKTCNQYKQLCIESYTFTSNKGNSKPFGRFACHCGFVYRRTGPDTSPEDRYRYSVVECYGPVWEATLRALWSDADVRQCDLEARLGVTLETIERHAARLGLPFPRPGSSITAEYVLSSIKKRDIVDEALREQYREKWLEARQLHPTRGMKFFQQNYSAIRGWLYDHDPQWLKDHSPSPVPFQGRKPRKATGALDAEVAEQIRKAAQLRRESSDRPVRITKTGLLRDIGYTAWFTTKIKGRFPETEAALSEEAETVLQWVARRLIWAKEYFCSQGVVPKPMRLMHYAGIRTYQTMPEVQEAVERTIREIANALSPLQAAPGVLDDSTQRPD